MKIYFLLNTLYVCWGQNKSWTWSELKCRFVFNILEQTQRTISSTLFMFISRLLNVMVLRKKSTQLLSIFASLEQHKMFQIAAKDEFLFSDTMQWKSILHQINGCVAFGIYTMSPNGARNNKIKSNSPFHYVRFATRVFKNSRFIEYTL